MKTALKQLVKTLFIPLFVVHLGHAQEDGGKGKKEKIERLKIAYITSELDLTSAESEKFWPVYNEMDDKIKELRKGNRKLEEDIRLNFSKLTDEEAKKKLTAILENEEREAKIKIESSAQFMTLLGAKRTLKLLSLEKQFRRELLERLSDPISPQNSGKQHDRE